MLPLQHDSNLSHEDKGCHLMNVDIVPINTVITQRRAKAQYEVFGKPIHHIGLNWEEL